MASSDVNPNSLNWLESMFHGFAQFSQTVNTAISGTLGSLAGLLDLYSFYKTYRNRSARQRKTKLATHLVSFSLNALYTVGVVLKLASSLALSCICVAIDLITVTRASYFTHQARKAVAETKEKLKNITHSYDPINENARFQRAEFQSLSSRLNTEREHRFKTKVEVGYSVAAAVGTGLFLGGVFLPPLFAAGLGLFLAIKTVQLIDAHINLGISRWIGNIWNKIKGEKKAKKPAPKSDYTENLLADSQDISRHQHVAVREPSARIVNTTFAHRNDKMLANHTRLFSQPKVVIPKRQSHLAQPKPQLYRMG